jgi:trans-2-enoyl-CoA reductase
LKFYNADRNNNAVISDCECPGKEKRRVKTVTILNGKAFSDRVKKVWNEAKEQNDKGWTDEMQQKVVDEIEKELKTLDHVEIKTRVSTNGDNNNKTIIIEVDAN